MNTTIKLGAAEMMSVCSSSTPCACCSSDCYRDISKAVRLLSAEGSHSVSLCGPKPAPGSLLSATSAVAQRPRKGSSSSTWCLWASAQIWSPLLENCFSLRKALLFCSHRHQRCPYLPGCPAQDRSHLCGREKKAGLLQMLS